MSAKVDVTQVLETFEGKPIKFNEQGMTLRDAAIAALLNPTQGKNLSSSESYRRYRVAKMVSEHDEVELSSKEVILILDAINDAFSPLIYGRCYDILEGVDD